MSHENRLADKKGERLLTSYQKFPLRLNLSLKGSSMNLKNQPNFASRRT